MPPSINHTKTFLLLKGAIQDRLDAEMILYNRKVQSFQFPVKQLKYLLIGKPQYGANEAGIERTSNQQTRYIRITDIDTQGLLKNELGVTAENTDEKYLLKNNDLLFARSGSVGRCYLHKSTNVTYPCIYAGYMIRFVLNENELTPDYFFIYTQLNVYKRWVNAIQRTAVQANINAEEYKSLFVPIPPLPIQQQIVDIFEAAYTNQQTKQAQAQQLLNSIDTYLLQQLSINPPPTTTQTQKMFMVQANTISNNRFDPYFHQAMFDALEKELALSSYKVTKLKHIATKITSGATPLSGGDAYTTKDLGIPFIRSGEINQFNDINFYDVLYIKPEVHNGSLKSSKLKKGDLMIAIVGATIGQVGIYNYDIEANINQAIALVRFNNEVDTEYIKSFYLASIGQKILDRRKRPVARANINLDEIGSMYVILPPLEKQREIAQHINQPRQQAQQLNTQAQQALQQAKQTIEAMITGTN